MKTVFADGKGSVRGRYTLYDTRRKTETVWIWDGSRVREISRQSAMTAARLAPGSVAEIFPTEAQALSRAVTAAKKRMDYLEAETQAARKEWKQWLRRMNRAAARNET